MKNRVYGIIGIKSVMANWNSDFSGFPKETTSGDVFGGDKALKYPAKYKWNEDGKLVLYIKSYKQETKGDVVVISPRTLKERYEQLFKIKDLKKEKDQSAVLKNLFSAIDVKQFGATFAEEGNNIGITGAVQIGQGFNKYVDSTPQEQQILSPFKDPKAKEKNKENEDAKSTTLGTKIVSDEAHYVYPFAITPSAYREYVEMGVTEGYTEKDYLDFKETFLINATAFNTNSKLGCENELGVFIEVEEETYLPDLAQFVTFEKGDANKENTFTLGFDKLVNSLGEKVKSIEIYYNPYTTKLVHTLENYTLFNIFTKEEVKK